MDFIAWDSSFETNIAIIDAQHKVLVKKINQLYNYIQENSTENIFPLLDELLEFTFYHFETEENYFSVYNYEDRIEHIKEHDKFRALIKSVKKEDVYDTAFQQKLFDFLNTWIIGHIKVVDMKYVDFLKSHLG